MAEETLKYVLSEEWTEGNGGGTTVEVHQQGSVAVAAFEGRDEPALFSDPENGLWGAWSEDQPPVLVRLVEPPSELEVGDAITTAAAAAAELNALEFGLARGENDMTIEGRSARHDILTIAVEWSATDSNGNAVTGLSTGSADLWTVDELPHSWLPYVAPKGFAMAAVPLAFEHADVAGFVLRQLESELKELGLLVRAEARSHTTRDTGGFKMEQNFTREVRISELEVISEAPPISLPDRPALTQTQYAGFMYVLFMGGDLCSGDAGTSRLDLDSPVRGEGLARLDLDDDGEGPSRLILGSLQPGPEGVGSGCLVVVVDPERIAEGTLPVSFPRRRGSPGSDNGDGNAFHMAGTQEEVELTLLQDGELEMRREGDGWRATLTGSALRLTMRQAGGSTMEDQLPVDVSFTFEVPVAAVGPPG